MSNDIIILGGGGHGKVVLEAVARAGIFAVKGIVDPALAVNSEVLGHPVLGGDDVLSGLYQAGVRCACIGVGTIGKYEIKKRMCTHVLAMGFELPVIAHPSSVVARDAFVDAGTFVSAGAVINPGARIGKNVIINTRAVIEHDCIIGNYAHIAPGAILCGGVHVGEDVHIGAGATVVQNVRIPDGAFIKAGEVVTR